MRFLERWLGEGDKPKGVKLFIPQDIDRAIRKYAGATNTREALTAYRIMLRLTERIFEAYSRYKEGRVIFRFADKEEVIFDFPDPSFVSPPENDPES